MPLAGSPGSPPGCLTSPACRSTPRSLPDAGVDRRSAAATSPGMVSEAPARPAAADSEARLRAALPTSSGPPAVPLPPYSPFMVGIHTFLSRMTLAPSPQETGAGMRSERDFCTVEVSKALVGID